VSPVTIALERVPARMAALGARAPWAVDLLIVAAIGALAARGPDSAPDGAAFIWSIGLALPLFLRRRWPAPVFAVIAVAAFVQWTTGVRAFGDAALLVAFYTVAATQPLRVTVAAAAVLEIGIVIAVARWAADDVELNAFVGLNALAVAAGAMGVNVRHRRALLTSLRERAARLEHERDQQGRLSAAAERSRIAREMHDIVAHNLSVMIALADGASYAVPEEPERAEAAMRNAADTGREALTEMRRLLGVLREDAAPDERAPQPGLAQIDPLVEQVRTAGLPVDCVRDGRPHSAVPAGLQLAAYRIVQEALTNTLKHAGPGARATVSLGWQPDRLRIEVRDTGQRAPTGSADGAGLRGMRERAAVYDGRVEAGAAPGGGWRVRTELRLAAAPTETADCADAQQTAEAAS
jgi:signal transduction histidine kinase